jgi:hypothetical protein|tara:strand:- start:87 stop:1556 length:1470 start_codon:yes stop_codon:yes gene_type:complete
MMNKPDSIVNIDKTKLDGVDRNSYNSIVYEFEVLKGLYRGCKYNGYHVLDDNEEVFDGQYYNSSTCEKFKELFQTGIPLSLTLIDYGIKQDMQNLESKLQKENDVIKNPLFFNKSVAPSGFKDPRNREQNKIFVEKIEKFNEVLKNPRKDDGSFYSKDELDSMGLWGELKPKFSKSTRLDSLSSLQTRLEEDTKHIKEIQGYMEDKGDGMGAEYVLVWEKFKLKKDPYKKDRVGDGNCTIKAGINAGLNHMKELLIPEEIIEKYGITEEDARHIGNLRNRKSKTIKDEIKEEDAAKEIESRKKDHNIDIKSKTNIDCLKEDYGFHTRTVNKILDLVESNIKQEREEKRENKTFIHYINDKAHKDNWNELQNKKSELESDGDTIVVPIATAGWKSGLFALLKVVKDNPDKRNFVALMHHTNYGWMNKWNGKGKKSGKVVNFESTLRYYIEEAMKPIQRKDSLGGKYNIDRTFSIKYMEEWRSDVKEEKNF